MAEALERARQPRGRAGAGVRQWATTAQTQRALLNAALEVFTERGFSNANVSDVAECHLAQ
jgi:AcrR family transcriptional regulator